MTCLKFETQEEYFKTLDSMTKDELKNEFYKNTYICSTIEHRYNTLRSHIYLDFIEKLDDYVKDIRETSLEAIENAIIKIVRTCCIYFDISLAIENFEHTKEAPISGSFLLKANKELFFTNRRYFNTFVELGVKTKNHALYLMKKLFNKTNLFFDQFVSYEGELLFEEESEVKQFEKSNLIDASDDPKVIVEEVVDSLMMEIKYCDNSFAARWLAEDAKTVKEMYS